MLPGVFYREIPTKNAYGGIGTGNEAFQYPWMFPALSFAGVGDANAMQIRTVGPEQSYYAQRITNAPAVGAGTLSDTVRYTSLLTDLYIGQNNSARL